MRTWKPIPIEEYFEDEPDLLIMWNSLEIKEEKRVPWYADEPNAHSKKVDLSGAGLWRTTFNPENNWNHLRLVAQAANVTNLPIDIKKAYKKVLSSLK